MYIDFHTHKPIYPQNTNVFEIISANKIVKYAENYFTIGLHPWWLEAPLSETDLQNLTNQIANPLCLGIGECGLDKLKGPPKAIQEEAFYQQIQLANQFNLPLIVHCVRQYDQILHFRKKYGRTPWVIHGFRRNKILAKSMLDASIMLSVSPLTNMNSSFEEMLKYLPTDQFFIETDSEYSLTIQQRYQIMANLKEISDSFLQVKMVENFEKFFGRKMED